MYNVWKNQVLFKLSCFTVQREFSKFINKKNVIYYKMVINIALQLVHIFILQIF